MSPNLRKLALAIHTTPSLGWVGAVAAYLVLVVAAMVSDDSQVLRSAWVAMELLGSNLLIPLSFASLLTGLAMSIGTRWGLFRHYWVVVSLVLTVIAAAVLLQHMQTVSIFAGMAAEADSSAVAELRVGLQGELLHAGCGLLVLLIVQLLNVYKPKGMTPYGRRTVGLATSPSPSGGGAALVRTGNMSTGVPRWVAMVGFHAFGLVVLFVAAHLINGGHPRH